MAYSFRFQRSREPTRSFWISTSSSVLAVACVSTPSVSRRSCSTRSRSCNFCPAWAAWRSSKSLRSPSMMRAAPGSSLRSISSAGTTSAPAVALGLEPRLACAQLVEALDHDARLVGVTVASSRTTTSPAFTLSSPITPPVGCLNFADHGSTGLGNIFRARAPRKMFTKRGPPCCGETRADGNQMPTS